MAKTHAATAAVLAAVLLTTVCGASAQMPAAAPGPEAALVPAAAPGPEAALGPAAAPGPPAAPGPEAALGPAAAPGPAVDECLNNLSNLTGCLTYVEEGSNLTTPEKPCCGELASLVDNSPICLCELLSKADSFGIKIDINRALKLPSVCNVATPPVSICAEAGYPVAAPMESEGPSGMTPGSPPPPTAASSPTPGNTGDRASRSVLLLVAGVGTAILPVFFQF